MHHLAPQAPSPRPPVPVGGHHPDHLVAVIGSGFAGLGMAIRLKQAGITSFVVLEKAGDLGGTWRDNAYPGAACDVPSHLYCYSFEPKADWSRIFAPQAEILGYLRHCAEKHGLGAHIRFHSTVVRASWDDEAQLWRLALSDGTTLTALALVSGKGGLHVPAYPAIEGLDRFAGRAFHSAEWDHGCDLAGKRVAVIGTGASAIQVVPAIAERVARLHLFQRTPPWIMPRADRAYSALEQAIFAHVPAAQWLHRQRIYWSLEPRALGFVVDQRIMSLAEAAGRRFIAQSIADPQLRAAVTPHYTAGCKRILLSDDYYPALTRPNVELVTDAVRAIAPRAVVTADGREREVDAIVLCTGFRATDYLYGMTITGRGGRDLAAEWRDGARAHLGITVHGFPNLFLLMGPNTGLGHNSMIFMIEAQIGYALQAIQQLAGGRARSLEVRAEVQRAFDEALQARLAKSVWASGCQSWYLEPSGRNSTIWPGFTVEYWARTRRFAPGDHVLLPSTPGPAAGAAAA